VTHNFNAFELSCENGPGPFSVQAAIYSTSTEITPAARISKIQQKFFGLLFSFEFSLL